MKLGEFLGVANENANYIVFSNETQDELARYDGKESIPSELNNREIVPNGIYAEIFDKEPFTVIIVKED